MRLTKAIEILDLRLKQLLDPDNPDLYPAVKLGIEALKLLQMFRDSPWASRFDELPGETDDA